MNLNLKMKKEIRLHWRIVEKEKEINKIAYKLYRLKKNNQDLLSICSLCLGHSVAFGTMFSQWMPRMFGCRGSVAFVDVESVTKCSFSHFKFFMKLCKYVQLNLLSWISSWLSRGNRATRNPFISLNRFRPKRNVRKLQWEAIVRSKLIRLNLFSERSKVLNRRW